jgi:hypothetical protein
LLWTVISSEQVLILQYMPCALLDYKTDMAWNPLIRKHPDYHNLGPYSATALGSIRQLVVKPRGIYSYRLDHLWNSF